MATYLFSENRELKNIHDGDVVVWDDFGRTNFTVIVLDFAFRNCFDVCFKSEQNMQGVEIYTAHFRLQTEPQTAPDIPVPCRSN